MGIGNGIRFDEIGLREKGKSQGNRVFGKEFRERD